MHQTLRRAAALIGIFFAALGMTTGAAAYEYGTSAPELSAFDASLSDGVLRLAFEGDTWWHEIDPVTFAYEDGTSTHAKLTITNSDVSLWLNGAQSWEWSCAAAGTLSRGGAHYAASIDIPVNALRGERFDLQLAGVTVRAAALRGAEQPESGEPSAPPAQEPIETPAEQSETPGAAYGGITVDGDFSDWDAVVKYDASAKDPGGMLAEAAMVFDGDTVYVYLREKTSANAGGAGSHGNAKFTLCTDLGGETLFQLPWDGSAVSGVEGATARRAGERWEIAIPASNLPRYADTISLGLYQGPLLVTDVADRSGGSGGSFAGIVFDGHYSDWDYYPHKTIQYAGAGTGEHVADGSAALYYSGADDRFYGHVSTEMPAHVAERGGEFGYAVTFRFNGDAGKRLGVMLAGVDGMGNIDWNAASRSLGSLAEGETRAFGIFDLETWHSSTNVDALSVDSDRMYGKMYVTHTAGRDECEFYLDLGALAAKYDMDEDEFHEIAAQFGRIGQEWFATAGASSGAWLGVGVSCAAVLGAAAYRRARRGEGAR